MGGLSRSECSKSRTTFPVYPAGIAVSGACIGLSDADGSKPIWGTSENNRRAKYYALTKSGDKQLEIEKRRLGDADTCSRPGFGNSLGGGDPMFSDLRVRFRSLSAAPPLPRRSIKSCSSISASRW